MFMRQYLLNKGKKLCMLLALIPLALPAQERITLSRYIETYKDIAMQEMRESGIPASIKLAQAILESGFGNSELAVEANNHFGIKCHGWPGMSYYYDDDEPQECFRKYTDPIQSFLDHSEFLQMRPWYASLFDLDPLDYRAWAHGLREAGYATNPRYAQLLIRLIEEHSLYRFDQKAMQEDYLVAEETGRPKDKTTPAMKEKPREIDREAALPTQRAIGTFNRISYVIALAGDTPGSLAREMDMRRRQILNYNDMDREQELLPGQRVYLQPKRRRGPEEFYVAREGDTMASISHTFGIRMENLYRRNDMSLGMEPEPGQRMYLQGYKGSVLDYLLRRP